jgi:hypothetical protein
MSGPFPEMRGSHLAGELERKRAARRLKRIENKRRKRERKAMANTGSQSATAPVIQIQPARKTNCGFKLDPAVRDTLLKEIGGRGRERVLTDLAFIRKDGTRQANASVIRKLLRSPTASFSSTICNLLKRLALHYRGEQQSLPLPKVTPPPLPAVLRSAPPTPPAVVQPAQQTQAHDVAFITQVVTAVIGALGPARAAPAVPQLPPIEVGAESEAHGDEYQAPTIKQFPDLSQQEQAGILNRMHTGYGQQVERLYGITSGHFAYAWNISYDAYHRETGIDIKARSSAESDRTGRRVTPLSLIQQDGDLVRFWQIVRKTWERA